MESKMEKYQCPLCDYKVTVKSSLDSHIRFHTQEKHFLCDQCKRGFVTKFYLNLHVKRVHEGKKNELNKYKCSLCPYTTYMKSMLKAHTQARHEDRTFPCTHPDCQYAGNSSRALQKHKRNIHKIQRKSFVCKFSNCGYRGTTRQVLRTHSAKHSEDRPFACDVQGCSYRAKLESALKSHKLGLHLNGHKPFACSVCDHSTNTKELLKKHELTHSVEKTVKSAFSGCRYSCKSKDYLRKHVLCCHIEKPFKCDFAGCSSTAASPSILEQHKKRAHCEKTFKCPTCDYRAKQLYKLQRHIHTHKTGREITCPNKGCSFRTRHRDHFNKHMQSHKQNLDCPVKGCGYVAYSSSSWKNHMQRHDPTNRPIPCPLCPKYFFSNCALSKHLPSHTQEKPFECPECNFAATYKTTMRNHMRTTHPQTVATKLDDESICDHCSVNFGCAVSLEMHTIWLKTAAVVLTRLQLKFDT